MADNDGGPAFPVTKAGTGYWGMTLLDYFAGRALTGLLLADEKAREEIGGDRRYSTADEFAEAAYRQADAMLAARAKKSGEGR